jgi:RimJ/RimL family protein N-acetyltransferase
MKPINYDTYYWQDDMVRLRAVEPDDWELHYYNRFDSPARRQVDYAVELPPTEAEARAFVERFKDFAEGTGRLMFTVENMQGEAVGGVNLNSIDERQGTFSIGMQIDRDHRGKGYGTAAMRLILRYAFFERRLHKYNGSVVEGNLASATMLTKVGCREEGRRRENVYTDGRYRDEILYGLTCDEFAALEEASAVGKADGG